MTAVAVHGPSSGAGVSTTCLLWCRWMEPCLQWALVDGHNSSAIAYSEVFREWQVYIVGETPSITKIFH